MPFKKNTAVTGFTVGLRSATDGSDITTGTPVGYYTLDGGTQTAIADVTPVHEGNGLWSFDLTAGEMNGDVVALTFTHASAITEHFVIKTETKLTSELNDFNSTSDAVATVTTLTNLPSIPANWLTASGIAASALDGKGDWNVGKTGYTVSTVSDKTGYSLSQAFPANFADLSISVTTGQVELLAATQASIDAIEADTNELQGDWVNGGRLDLILDARASQASIDTIDGIVDSILVDTGTDIPARFDGIEGATFSTATDSLEALRDRGDAAWTTGAGGTPPQLLQSTTIATLASQTSFTLTAGSADNDAYNGAVAVVTDSVTSTQKAVGSISDYVGSTRTVTLTADPAIFTMAVGDSIDIIANASTAPTAAAVRAEIDSNSTQLAAIVADTNELQLNQGNWLTATGFATSGALATAQADLDIITGADGVNLLSATQASITAIEADTNEMQGDLANGGRLDLIFDAILVDTGATIPAQITGLNNFDPTTDTVVNVTTVATVTNEVQADINRINGVLITGDGSVTPFDV